MQLRPSTVIRAKKLFPELARAIDSAVNKLYMGIYRLTPDERHALALLYYLQSPWAYRIDIARRARTGNPFREPHVDVPGVDTPDKQSMEAYQWAKNYYLSHTGKGKGTILYYLQLYSKARNTPAENKAYTTEKVYRPVLRPPTPLEEGKAEPGEKHTAVSIAPVAPPRHQAWKAEETWLADYLWENIPRSLRGKWSYVQVLHLARLINRLAREKGIDPRSIDWAHEIDWSQGYGYAKEKIRSILMARGGIGAGEAEEYTKLAQTAPNYVPAWITEEQPPEKWEQEAWIQAALQA